MPHPVPRRVATLAVAFCVLAASLVGLASPSGAQFAKLRTTTYASLSTSTVTAGKTVSVRTTTRPKQAGHRVYLQQKVGTRWKSVQRKALGSASRASFTVRPTTAGTKLFRVFDPPTRRHRASVSRTLKLVVKKAPTSVKCTAGYSPCIAPGPDVDCAGGSGDGPRFVEGPVLVSGSDPYRLDPDKNGLGCR